MGFFKKIFKKKKGGTLFGNILRKVGSAVSGGKLGQGKHMIPKDDPNEEPTVKQSIAEQIGSTVGNFANETLMPVVSQALTGNSNTTSSNLLSSVTDPLADSAIDSFWTSLKKRWYLIALPFGLIIFLIWYFGRKKTNRRSYR